MSTSIDDVAQLGLIDGRGVMDLSKVGALFGVNDTSGKSYADLYPEDGPSVDSGDGFQSKCMRCSSRVY